MAIHTELQVSGDLDKPSNSPKSEVEIYGDQYGELMNKHSNLGLKL